TITDTLSPSVAITNTPTNTIAPTQPLVTTDAYLNLTIQFPGIGTPEGNNQPRHPMGSVTAFLYAPQMNIFNQSSTPIYTFSDTVTFSPATGKFSNTTFH